MTFIACFEIKFVSLTAKVKNYEKYRSRLLAVQISEELNKIVI
jgi:hypothetical protein